MSRFTMSPVRHGSRVTSIRTAGSSRRCAASATATRSRRGLAEGVIDCLCSDHTPVDEDGKHRPFAEAEPGATGLELLLPLALKWGAARKLALGPTLARITSEPARILRVGSGRLAAGAPAMSRFLIRRRRCASRPRR